MSQTKSALLFLHGDSTKIRVKHDEIFVSYLASFCSSIVGNNNSLLVFKPHRSSHLAITTLKQPKDLALESYHRCFTHKGSINLQHLIMAPGALSTNDAFREFYAPRPTEPSTRHHQQRMPPVEHQKPQMPIELRNFHNSVNHTKPDDDDQVEAGCLGEIKNYKAGDEFVLLWKWVDDFMDKRRAKKDSSKLHTVNQSTLQPIKPRQAPKPAATLSPEAVRRQATDREDMREYKAQRQTLWAELFDICIKWKDQKAKKKVDQARQRRHEEVARIQATKCRDEPTRGRSTNRHEPPRTTPSLPDQNHSADSQPDIARKPVPVYEKKRGEVQKHAVKIATLPPVHNSIHLQHTPSNNYRTRPSPARGQKDESTRDTRFSDFLHQERNASQQAAPSRETQWTYAVPGEDDEPARNSRFSSVLDPAKAIKRAKEAEKAKDPACYICSSSSRQCYGGYRDNISRLWVCEDCQRKENMCPVQCSVCGMPNSPNTGYADNRLWMCTGCRFPTTPMELPPSPKLSRTATSKPTASRSPIPQGVDKTRSEDTEHCECDHPCSRVEMFGETRFSTCRDCHKRLTPFPVIHSGVPISEYDSDHLYSDDSYETRPPTPRPHRPNGLGIAYRNPEQEDDNRPTPPLKDRKYYQNSPTLPATVRRRSYARKPSMKHPHAPPHAPTPRKASPSSAPYRPRSPTSRHPPHHPTHPFNPTTYPYPSPPSTPPPLHRPRPASSVYPTDEPGPDFPYPPPPIPSQYVNRSPRSGSASPASVGAEGGRRVLNRRSSWYDFWKPVFEKTGEKGA